MSGTISGGAETFFGKSKGKTIDKILSKVTTVVAIRFALLVIVVYISQPETNTDTDALETEAAQVVEAADAAADAVSDNVQTVDDTGAAD